MKLKQSIHDEYQCMNLIYRSERMATREHAIVTSDKISKENLVKILGHIEEIQYGSVTITIQNNKLVQIDKNEKIRIV